MTRTTHPYEAQIAHHHHNNALCLQRQSIYVSLESTDRKGRERNFVPRLLQCRLASFFFCIFFLYDVAANAGPSPNNGEKRERERERVIIREERRRERDGYEKKRERKFIITAS